MRMVSESDPSGWGNALSDFRTDQGSNGGFEGHVTRWDEFCSEKGPRSSGALLDILSPYDAVQFVYQTLLGLRALVA